MELHFRRAGDGPPLVLLHGLFGSNENLGNIARELVSDFTVIGLDLRNHGRSPHGDRMDYATMAGDVIDTLDANGLDSVAVLGHSLGGKTAMELALSAPDRVERLIVADIAPVAYDRRHDQELEALHALDLDAIGSRKDADEALADAIPNPAIRQFLLKNLARGDDGFRWRIPLETIYSEYADIAAAPTSTGPYDGPALFIRGGESDYVTDEAETDIRERFPAARIETIPGANHWVHVDAPDAFLKLVSEFLKESRTANNSPGENFRASPEGARRRDAPSNERE
ncbi:MAG: alpha/beta fold hydrolase [Halofilum sp. (in: g-proteobacteria)]|nr:alpha/beta fold hydrolase [Halofilum sp. (in: g-proteobacteria)]